MNGYGWNPTGNSRYSRVTIKKPHGGNLRGDGEMTRAYDTYRELTRIQATLRAEIDNLHDEISGITARVDAMDDVALRLNDLVGSVVRVLENEYGGDWDVGD